MTNYNERLDEVFGDLEDFDRYKCQLLVKLINNLSFQLGHPKDDLVFIIKEMIKKGEL